MADDANPAPVSENVQPTPAAAPAPRSQEGPRRSWADMCKRSLRSFLYGLIGAAVGAVAGVVLKYVLGFLQVWNGDIRLVAGAGLLLGIFFNGTIIRLLRLAPRREMDAQTGHAAPSEPPPEPIREAIEMLVSVVILVVLLKCFDAEAYVIPTGSMAETLLGDQKWVTCPSCGYRFPVDVSEQVDPMKAIHVWVNGCTCPNCLLHIRFTPRNGIDGYEPGPADLPDPDWGGGDRILAAKFMYDLFGMPPDRLDVVVFRYPGDGTFPPRGSFSDGVPINFIKRLVGLEQETIAVHGGDLYVLSPDKGLRYDSDLQKAAETTQGMDPARRLWETQFLHTNDPEALERFKRGEFQILHKPPETLLAMKRIVYDNNHPAKDLHAVRWADRDKDGAWKADDSHGFRLDAPADDKVHWLGYQHRLRGEEDKPQLISDVMGYNTGESERGAPRLGANWVGDLILECEVQADQPQGELTLELSKGVDRFRAHFDLASGVCTLLRDGQDQPLDSRPTAMKGGGRHSVRFADVDERLTVWVDDALPFGDGATYPPPGKDGRRIEGPTENDLQPASIGLKGTSAAVHNLRLWRDTYYTTALHGDPASPDWMEAQPDDGTRVNPADPKTWGNLSRLPTRTMYVQPKHYLCMGDNSPRSSDGRFWGLVPKRLLLGKALAVFYPLDRFERIR
jgi:signal peptidase I